jgi:hypothetical protein
VGKGVRTKQGTDWNREKHMLLSCWITNAADIISEYVIIIALIDCKDCYTDAVFYFHMYIESLVILNHKCFCYIYIYIKEKAIFLDMLIILQSSTLDENIFLTLTIFSSP